MKLYRNNYSLFRMNNISLVLCVLVAVLAVTQGDYDKNNNNRYDGRYVTQSNGPHVEYFTNDNAMKTKQTVSYKKDPGYHSDYDWPSTSNTNTQKAVAYNHDPAYHNHDDWSVDGKGNIHQTVSYTKDPAYHNLDDLSANKNANTQQTISYNRDHAYPSPNDGSVKQNLKNPNLATDIKEPTVININNPDQLFPQPIVIDESNSFDHLKNLDLDEKPLSDQADNYITENRPIFEHIQNLDLNEKSLAHQADNYINQNRPDLDHDENFDLSANPSGDHTDNYIKLNKLQLDDLVQYYYRKLKHVEKNFLLRLEGIHLIRDLVADRIIQNEQDLNPTTLLGDVHKQCVDEHRLALLTENGAQSAINLCYTTAKNDLSNILNDARDTAQKFEAYYKEVYLSSLSQCPRDESYTQCVLKATIDAITFSIKSKKTFDSQINIAICRVKEALKDALDCAYETQVKATTKIAEAKKYIEKCIYDQLNCKKCQGVICDEYAEVSSGWKSLQNPFYGMQNQTGCLRLELKQ